MGKTKVVMFCGGSGSATISNAFAGQDVSLTLLMNCYDDGKSTGRLRQYIPGMLGPSDVRKNAARLGFEHQMNWLEARVADPSSLVASPIFSGWVQQFLHYEYKQGVMFDWTDCPRGNIIFAGCYLDSDKNYNLAVSKFAAKCGCPPNSILNMTDGSNLRLVAVDEASTEYDEFEISTKIGLPLIKELRLLKEDGTPTIPEMNPEVRNALEHADIIIYGPGTQHSSLLPSYMTKGTLDAILASRALKVFIANTQNDYDTWSMTLAVLTERMRKVLIGSSIRHRSQNVPWHAFVDYSLIAAGSSVIVGDDMLGPIVIDAYKNEDNSHNGEMVVRQIMKLFQFR